MGCLDRWLCQLIPKDIIGQGNKIIAWRHSLDSEVQGDFEMGVWEQCRETADLACLNPHQQNLVAVPQTPASRHAEAGVQVQPGLQLGLACTT